MKLHECLCQYHSVDSLEKSEVKPHFAQEEKQKQEELPLVQKGVGLYLVKYESGEDERSERLGRELG